MHKVQIKPEWQPGDYILAPFDGERPPMKAWVKETLDHEPERSSFELDGAEIELLTWGEIGKPGLLLLHGAGAQADWWDIIAPYFANGYRVAAISWSGMGRSSWREAYRFKQWAREALRAIEIAELDRTGPPVVIAHSLGGSGLMTLAAGHPEKIAAGILVDSFVPRLRPGQKPPSSRPLPRYATIEQALSRYRFVPEQGTDYPEIVDHIARHGLRAVAADENDPAGYTWRFDPKVLTSLDIGSIEALPAQIAVPFAFIAGEKSNLSRNTKLADVLEAFPKIEIAFTIPEARHHIMVDQPLALVAALRATLQALEHSG